MVRKIKVFQKQKSINFDPVNYIIMPKKSQFQPDLMNPAGFGVSKNLQKQYAVLGDSGLLYKIWPPQLFFQTTSFISFYSGEICEHSSFKKY